jgi:CPA1 family monovalent cation:H+ antiporter
VKSLFNDASALIIYRLAVGATVSGSLSGWTVLPTLLIVTLGSVILGGILSWIILKVNTRIRDVATAIVVQFCSTFGAWMLAERLHLSGIITMVVFAMMAARRSPEILPARIRIPAWAVWEVAVFVLNVLAFILVGFQLRSITERATGGIGARYALVAAIVCIVVILARIAWVSGAAALSRWRCCPRLDGAIKPEDVVGLSARGAVLVGWCGMRGTVTLAAALALPTEFPHRDLILATAFGVTLGTLVLQGMTVCPLLFRLRLKDDGTVDREVRFARLETLKSGLAAVALCPETETVALVRHSYELQLRRAEQVLADTMDAKNMTVNSTAKAVSASSSAGQEDSLEVVHRVIKAQRRRLVELRAENTIGDVAFQRIEEEFDWMELGWAQLRRQ